MGKRIICYRPSPNVHCFSLTGGKCELQCPHCMGKHLRAMKPTLTPKELSVAFRTAQVNGAGCILLSGGFGMDGRLPVSSFIETLAQAKMETGLKVEAHLGLLDDQEVERLGRAGVDAFLLDIVGDQNTIDHYLGGTWRIEDYARVIGAAKKWIPTVAPHVLIGVEGGNVKGEYKAIDIAASARVDSLAILALVHENLEVNIEEVEKVMQYARDRMRSHLTLGCMRGSGKMRLSLEKMAVALGFDGIANPAKETVEYAKSLGLLIVEKEGCCVFAP